MQQGQLVQAPPSFCQYVGEACDKDFADIKNVDGLFLYASRPEQIAAAIETAKTKLEDNKGRWRSWRDFDVGGRIIFCEICKGIRGAATVFADVTTLNFNLLFEIGFCLGLGVSVIPIRDPNYAVDKREFDSLGVLDTLGYLDFANSDELAQKVQAAKPADIGRLPLKTYRDTPVYLLKGPVPTEGTIQLLSTLKKSPLRFRTHDPVEVAQRSLHAHWKQVRGSYGVIANLLAPARKGATAHNALCALLCGIAMAEEKAVLMLQEEGGTQQPIDYRDVVRGWDNPSQIPHLVEPTINETFERLQDVASSVAPPPEGLLERVDLGNPAAEEEIGGLQDYFVRTGQFRAATHGGGRLVVGRKGAGKTAMFFGVRDAVKRGLETLVLDMRPEGHQFTRLREAILEELSEGQREYTITAFWTYLLSAEIAHKILQSPAEFQAAERDPERFRMYKELEKAYLAHGLSVGDDLSQRLLREIDRLSERFDTAGDISGRTDLAELVYGGDIRTLNDAVANYVTAEKDEVWLLIDNLDKSWATRGSTREDMLIVLGLLEASRKLEEQLADRGVDFRCLVFIRTDVLEKLNWSSPDRGKESTINLEWDDPQLFQAIVRERIAVSAGLTGTFEDLWRQVAEPAIGVEDSFRYLLDRTLMRPRDLLLFLQRALQVALSRSHDRITGDDFRHAERGYSEEALLWLGYEIEDTHPGLTDGLLAFHGASACVTREQVVEILERGNVPTAEMDSAIEILLWFGFLGTRLNAGEELYSHEVQSNLRRLTYPVETDAGRFVVHPMFRAALGMEEAAS